MIPSQSTSVLIIGAGLTGLMTAVQFLRYGVQPTIIDVKQGPDRSSRRIWLNRRSFELLDQLGLAEELSAQLDPVERIQLGLSKEPVQPFESLIKEGNAEAKAVWMQIPQKDIEHVLIQRLTSLACSIHWDTELITYHNKTRSVEVQIRRDDRTVQWETEWLIAAHGAKGPVRQQTLPESTGAVVSMTFSRWTVPATLKRVHLPTYWSDGSNEALVMFSPSGERVEVEMYTRSEDPTDLQKHIKSVLAVAELPVRTIEPAAVHIESYDLQPVLQAGSRNFLVGGAAHGWPADSFQGVQSGWEDCANLAWKLAAVQQKRLSPPLLHSYALERQNQHLTVLFPSTSQESLGIFAPLITSLFKGIKAKQLLYQATHPVKKQRLLKQLAGFGTNYRNSNLSFQYVLDERYSAGDRLPELSVFDEKVKKSFPLQEWSRKPGFALLLLGTLSTHTLQAIGQWVQYRYPHDLHLYYLPFSSSNAEVFRVFEVKNEANKMILVRPDGYFAYINDTVNIGLIDTYMQEVLGLIDHSHYRSR